MAAALIMQNELYLKIQGYHLFDRNNPCVSTTNPTIVDVHLFSATIDH